MSGYPSTFQTESTPPSSGNPKAWLWVGLVGGLACLVITAIVAGMAGWMYTSSLHNNATSTAHFLNESGTATADAKVVLPPTGWKLTIDEQFTSNENQWDVGSIEGEYGSGDLTLEGQSYQWQIKANSEEGVTWWSYPAFDHRMGDFYASAECRLVGGDVGNASCGLAFRLVDGDNYYKFAINDDQLMNVSLVKRDQWTNLIPWDYTYLVRPGEMNRLAILAEGVHYRFFINDILVFETENDSLFGGKAALYTSIWGANEVVFQFDNFQVYEPER